MRPNEKESLRNLYGGSYTHTAPRDERATRVENAKQERERKRQTGTPFTLTRDAQENRFRPKHRSRLY